MATDCITQVTFQGDGFAKPVVARFDLPDASADGGLVLFKALDTQLGLTRRLAACLDDATFWGRLRARRGTGCLDLRVGPDNLRRALRIMDALVKALEIRGFAVTASTDPKPEAGVAMFGETVQIGLEEKIGRVDRVLTPAEKESHRRGARAGGGDGTTC